MSNGRCFFFLGNQLLREWKGWNTNLRAQNLSMRKRDQEALEPLIPDLILNMRDRSCGCDVQQCPVSALSSGSPVGWWVGGGEQLCCLPGHQPGTKKWQAFNGSFWRWLLYYSGSANLTWPNEDLAPRHLLVSHFIMSSSPVHACPGIMGVCLSESPGQRRNIDWTTFWKYCQVRPKHISGHSVLFLKISDYSSFLLFLLLKTKKNVSGTSSEC